MKYKAFLIEFAWIASIYIVNFIAINSLIKPVDVLLPTLNINFDDSGIRLSGQGFFIPTFLILVSLVYFIKTACFRFKKQLQNYIAMVSSFVAIIVLFWLSLMLNAMSLLIAGLQQMAKKMSDLTEKLMPEIGDGIEKALPTPASPLINIAKIVEKMPQTIVVTQIVLIIMLTVCAVFAGRNLKRPVVIINEEIA